MGKTKPEPAGTSGSPAPGIVASIPGPVTDRRCTDIFFLLLFIAFWIGMIVVASISLAQGDPRRLYKPTDVYGNFCGMDNTLFTKGLIYDFDTAIQGQNTSNCNIRNPTTDQKKNCDMRINFINEEYLVFLNPSTYLGYGGFCASKCPAMNSNNTITCPNPTSKYTAPRGRPTIVANSGSTTSTRCAYDRYSMWQGTSPIPTESSYPASVSNGVYLDSSNNPWSPRSDFLISSVPSSGATGVVQSTSFVFRCIPNSGLDPSGSSAAAKLGDQWGQFWGDVTRCWRIFLICTATAFVGGFVWLLLMKVFAGAFVWITILLCFALLVFIGWYFTDRAQQKEDANPSSADDNDTKALRYTGYAFYACAFIFFCVIVFLRKRIQLAIAIVKEASDAIRDMPLIIFFPLWMVIIVGGFLAYWIAVACYLMSIADPSIDWQTMNGFERPGEIDWSFSASMRYVLIYHFFGLLWTLGFLLAIVFLVIAIAMATWYFIEPPKQSLPSHPVLSAVGTTLRYHLGTLAFGSLIIAIVQFIRAMILYFHKQIEKFSENTPCQCCVKCLICYCQCCLSYLQRFLEFISKNAYVQTAVNGYSFCKAAKRAWSLICDNLARIGTVNFVADFITFTGKLAIVIGNCCLALYLTKQDWAVTDGADELHSPVLIVVIVFIITWFIAQLFMHVYESAIVALLVCFLVDESDYGGRFCSPTLKKYCEVDEDDGKKVKKANAKAAKDAKNAKNA
eukprot:ANDGO_02906.mRNA.1 Choline transporter-like protein 2